MKKTRQLGVRFRRIEDGSAVALAVIDGKGPLIELYDIESGDAVGNVARVELTYDVAGCLEAKVKLYPTAQDVIPAEGPK